MRALKRAIAMVCAIMGKSKSGAEKFPHVKGLQKKRTKSGHRWILTDVDFSGKSRSITVKISDTDPIDVFFRKVNEARQALKRKCECKAFSEYLEAFFSMRQLSEGTAHGYRNALQGFSFDDRKNARQMNEVLKAPRKQSTQKGIVAKINAFFRWLIQRGEPIKNPAADIVIKANTPRRTRILTDDEMTVLMRYIRRRNPEYRLFVLLLIHTGARVSTVGALAPSSLDASGRLHLFNVKCRKKYDVAIPLSDAETLDLWQSVASSGTLWTRAFDVHARRLSQWLRTHFGKDANGEYLSAHSLRHTFASRAVQAGVPIEIVSKMLDHSSISTTLAVYAKFSQEQIDKAVEMTNKK